jgi:copper chaperone CopZ
VNEDRDTVDLHVPTVHCGSCNFTIEETLDELAGVAGREVDLDTKQVRVTFDPDSITPATIVAAIEQAGYAVET